MLLPGSLPQRASPGHLPEFLRGINITRVAMLDNVFLLFILLVEGYNYTMSKQICIKFPNFSLAWFFVIDKTFGHNNPLLSPGT